MNKIRIAVVGYGNIGRYAVESVQQTPDMELAGVVRSSSSDGKPTPELAGIPVTDDITKLGKVDVALLCKHTRGIREYAEKYLAMGINTVDSFDIHSSIYEMKTHLDKLAKENNTVAIVSAGWDPGSDSVVRALLEACAPRGITYTNFGPGMSMGHTTAVKSIPGVKNAISLTIPLGTGIHRRMVYVQPEAGTDFNEITNAIKNDPYFIHDETFVIQVDDADAVIDSGHGVNLTRKGVSGATNNQLFDFNMKVNNPALTTQIMTSCARAAMKQMPGAYTMIEIPLIDMLYGDRETLIKKLV